VNRLSSTLERQIVRIGRLLSDHERSVGFPIAWKQVLQRELAEIVGPGVSAECIEARNGSHIQEDHFLPEIVDPETGEPLAPGQEGELVLTPATKEALPLIRYRTGDISSLEVTPCVCGRTTVRMSRIKGRYG
jgi:phenylacetate-coenzyme A ligase PaaK-like adenylate-forming protein